MDIEDSPSAESGTLFRRNTIVIRSTSMPCGTVVAMMATMIGTIVVVLFGAGQFLVSHLSDINANVNSGMTRVESAIDDLKDDVDGLRTDVNSIKADVGDLRADVGGLKEDVDGLKDSLAD